MQVVVDAIDPSVLVSACASRQFDFLEMQEQELHNVVIPLDLEVGEKASCTRLVRTLLAMGAAASRPLAGPSSLLLDPPGSMQSATTRLEKLTTIPTGLVGPCAGTLLSPQRCPCRPQTQGVCPDHLLLLTSHNQDGSTQLCKLVEQAMLALEDVSH